MIFNGQYEWCMLWQKWISNTYSTCHIWYFSWPHDLWPRMTFIGQIKYNCAFNRLYPLNGACYDQSLHETHIVSHTLFSVDLMTFDNFTLGQLFMWIGANNDQIWLLMLDEWLWAMFEPTWTLPNFTFGQLFMWSGANNNQIWLAMG